jgi:hypothetical protein
VTRGRGAARRSVVAQFAEPLRGAAGRPSGTVLAVPYVVLCGPFQGPPDSIVGPFESIEDANEYAQAQAGDPEQRFAAVMALVAPDST